jgi:hypothetical protein
MSWMDYRRFLANARPEWDLRCFSKFAAFCGQLNNPGICTVLAAYSHINCIRPWIQMETVQYVANLNKYYIAYKSMGAVWEKRKIERDKLK